MIIPDKEAVGIPKPGVHLRIIIGVTGASGSIYGWRLLEKLRAIAEMGNPFGTFPFR